MKTILMMSWAIISVVNRMKLISLILVFSHLIGKGVHTERRDMQCIFKECSRVLVVCPGISAPPLSHHRDLHLVSPHISTPFELPPAPTDC